MGTKTILPTTIWRSFYRGCGRGRGRGRGWLNEDITERDSSGGRGRSNFCGNGRGQYGLQRNWEYYRQDRSGFTSTHDEGRRDIRLEMPPEPEPSRFSDWSSLGSPPTRTSPHSAPDVQAEQIDNVQDQLNVSTAGEIRQERVETSNSEIVNISPQTEQLGEDQDIPAIVRPTPLNIGVRTQRNDMESNEENANNIPPSQIRSARPSLHADDVLWIRNVTRESNTHDDLSRDSQIRTQNINIGEISSIHPVDRSIPSSERQIVLDNRGSGPSYQHEGMHPQRTSTTNRRDSSDNSSDNSRFQRGRGYANERGRPPERERYPSRDRRPPRRRGVSRDGRPPDRYNRGPPDEGGLPDGGGPLGGGGQPDDGGPPDDGRPPSDNGGPPRCPNRRGTPGARGPLGPIRPLVIQQPQVVLDTTALENTFNNMGQSMLQLARVQDQTNRHLQQHIQQGQLNIQAHAGALHKLANSTHQRNYDQIFASIPVYDGSNRDEFFPWLDRLEAACYYCGRDIKTEALGRSAGPVQNVIMALPHNKLWSAI